MIQFADAANFTDNKTNSMKLTYNFILLFSSLLLLQACASAVKQGVSSVPVEDRSVENNQNDSGSSADLPEPDIQKDAEYVSTKNEITRENKDKKAVVVALLENAEARMESGDKASAAATLERALRLEPKNAMLWHRLGLIRLQQKNWQQAINLAKRSNSLAARDYYLQSANWKLIAQANSRAGNKAAAKQAADMASKLDQFK